MTGRSGTWLLALLVVALCLFSAAEGEEPPRPDRVAVYKAKRKLYLYKGDRILKAYNIALGRNPKGHKQREGDSRTPEGRYILDWRNPDSKYHLAIHISYPNDADRERARKRGESPGGDIMLHGYPDGAFGSIWSRYWFLGKDWTDGCIALPNAAMDQIWKSVRNGTPIDIYP